MLCAQQAQTPEPEGTLYAGPFVGEFGHELFAWQGRLRHLSKQYNQTIVACKAGQEYLYHDFASYLTIDLSNLDAFKWRCQSFQTPSFSDVFGHALPENATWLPPNKPLIDYHWNQPETIWPEQSFFRYGQNLDGPPSLEWDIAFHARSRSRNPERNWPPDRWEQLVDTLDEIGLNGYTIGGTDSAYVAGDDMRGVSLQETCNLLARTALIVGPASGPIHLANLCGCAALTWYGTPYDERNHKRFLTDWNIDPAAPNVLPLYVPDWLPSAEEIADAVGMIFSVIYDDEMMEDVEPEPEPLGPFDVIRKERVDRSKVVRVKVHDPLV